MYVYLSASATLSSARTLATAISSRAARNCADKSDDLARSAAIDPSASASRLVSALASAYKVESIYIGSTRGR